MGTKRRRNGDQALFWFMLVVAAGLGLLFAFFLVWLDEGGVSR